MDYNPAPLRPLSHKLPDDGVNHQGQHTPEGSKEGTARATNDDAQDEEEDDINPNELHEVEAHRDGGPRQATKAIDNRDKYVRELLHDNLQGRKSGCARRQGNPHEGRGNEQRGDQGEEEVGEEKDERGAAEIVTTEGESADLRGQADGHEAPRGSDQRVMHVDKARDAGSKQQDEEDGCEAELKTDIEETERVADEHQQRCSGQRIVRFGIAADGHTDEIDRQHGGCTDSRRRKPRHSSVSPRNDDHQAAANDSERRRPGQDGEQEGKRAADERHMEAADGQKVRHPNGGESLSQLACHGAPLIDRERGQHGVLIGRKAQLPKPFHHAPLHLPRRLLPLRRLRAPRIIKPPLSQSRRLYGQENGEACQYHTHDFRRC